MILKIQDKKVIVLTKDCKYYNLRRRPGMCKGQKVEFEKSDIIYTRETFTGYIKFAGYAASVLIIFASILFFYMNSSNNVFGYIAVDINPSLEISIDKRYCIKDVSPLNDDAVIVIEKLDLKGLPIKDALPQIFKRTKELGFLDLNKKDVVLISTAQVDEEMGREEEIESIVVNICSDIKELKNDNINTQVIKVQPETRALAMDNNISMGRYKIYEEAKKSGLQVSVDSIRNESLENIIDKVELSVVEINPSDSDRAIGKTALTSPIPSSTVRPTHTTKSVDTGKDTKEIEPSVPTLQPATYLPKTPGNRTTVTPRATLVHTMPSNTPTNISTITFANTPINLPTNVPSSTPASFPTNGPVSMHENTHTNAYTNTPTRISISTPANTSMSMPTSTPANIPTSTPRSTTTSVPTNTPTNTPTSIPVSTPTNTPVNMPTYTPTDTPTNTPTNTPASTSAIKPHLITVDFEDDPNVTDKFTWNTSFGEEPESVDKHRKWLQSKGIDITGTPAGFVFTTRIHGPIANTGVIVGNASPNYAEESIGLSDDEAINIKFLNQPVNYAKLCLVTVPSDYDIINNVPATVMIEAYDSFGQLVAVKTKTFTGVTNGKYTPANIEISIDNPCIETVVMKVKEHPNGGVYIEDIVFGNVAN